MEARELDALIAEKVMGLEIIGMVSWYWADGDQRIYIEEYGEPDEPAYLDECLCSQHEAQPSVLRPVRVHGHYTSCLGVVPAYSTDIAAAWTVVEKLRNDGWYVSVEANCRPHAVDAIFAAHGSSPERRGRGLRKDTIEIMQAGDTAPLAICLAALATAP